MPSFSEPNNARIVQTADNEQEGNALIRNVAVYLPDDTSAHLRRSESSEVKNIVSNLEASNRLRKSDLHSVVLCTGSLVRQTNVTGVNDVKVQILSASIKITLY
jgi:hypothetical protein